MTNKEAIRILSNMIHDDKMVYGDKPKSNNEAHEIAIKALKFIDENYPKTFIDYLNGEQI